MKYAELKRFCICVDVYQVYEGNDYDNQLYEGIDYDKIYEVLSTLKNKKIKNKQYPN